MKRTNNSLTFLGDSDRDIVKRKANSCSCGGPGGHPGMIPICRTCYKLSHYVRQVENRLANSNSQTGVIGASQ